jgi:hypothetical protein
MTCKPVVATLAACGLLAAASLACSSSSSRMHGDAVPADAKNPIEVYFSGITIAQAVDIANGVLTDRPYPTVQVDPERGYLETQWLDVESYERFVGAYPDSERMVRFYWQFTTEEDEVRLLTLSAVYRPMDPARDRLVPLDPPAYTMALKMEEKFKTRVVNQGGRIVTDQI